MYPATANAQPIRNKATSIAKFRSLKDMTTGGLYAYPSSMTTRFRSLVGARTLNASVGEWVGSCSSL